jgi:hypothetical protein
MFISRLLCVAALISISVMPAKAQSSPAKVSEPAKVYDSAQPQPVGPMALPEFLEQIADPPQNAPGGIPINPSQQQFHLDQSQSLAPPEPEHGDASCFSMRTYRVKRDQPQSDATRFAGYSECQPAHRYQTQDAGIFLEIVPR